MLLPQTHRCFVYGTLMSPEVLQTLLDRIPTMDPRPAVLPPEYTRHPVKARVFPGVIDHRSLASIALANVHKHSVQGILLTDVTPDELKVFDWFEADEYDRVSLPVRLLEAKDGSNEELAVDANVYLWCAGTEFLEVESPWNFENFQTKKLDWYLGSTVRPCREEYDRERARQTKQN